MPRIGTHDKPSLYSFLLPWVAVAMVAASVVVLSERYLESPYPGLVRIGILTLIIVVNPDQVIQGRETSL